MVKLIGPWTCLAIIGCLQMLVANAVHADQRERQPVSALYIPLADHYAAIVAYEKYRHEMKFAEFSIEQMSNWDLLRANFLEGNSDMAFSMTPLALDMFNRKPTFRWVGLMHRDGNGLAVNHLLAHQMNLASIRGERSPDEKVADVLKRFAMNKPIRVGVPHLHSTHTVVLYKFLRDHGMKLSLMPNESADVLAISVAPAKSPAFVRRYYSQAEPAGIEQSLPWIDVVETESYGQVAWYSKNVLPSEHGHVECIALATDKALAKKPAAVQEVMHYIKLAGSYIEQQRMAGGDSLEEIVALVQKHIPAHTDKAIRASLNPNLRVINYTELDVDKPGLHEIMELAIESDVLDSPVDLDDFAWAPNEASEVRGQDRETGP